MSSTRVRLTVDLDVSAPVRDRVALAREIATRQGFRVLEAVALPDEPEPPAQADLFGDPHAQ